MRACLLLRAEGGRYRRLGTGARVGHRECKGRAGVRLRRGLPGLVCAYVGLTFAGTWVCWGLSALLGQVVRGAALTASAGAGDALNALAGALQVMGTLVPAVVAYALFPRVRALGLAAGGGRDGAAMGHAAIGDPDCDAGGDDDPHAGFWALAFGARPHLGGWLFFVVLAAWRWVMFRAALGFPETPGAALVSFFATLPALLLGGGFEEIGWRGVLQPALTRLIAGDSGGSGVCGMSRRVAGVAIAPLLTGVIWACWHLPLFVMAGTYQHGLAFLPFVGIAVALSYSLGALRALTGGTLACILGHAWYNAMLVAPLAPLMVGAADEGLAGQAALFGTLFALEAIVGAAILVLHATRGTQVSAV